jgi:hypothetical protein
VKASGWASEEPRGSDMRRVARTNDGIPSTSSGLPNAVGFNRRMRKTACPVVWEGSRSRFRHLGPIKNCRIDACHVLLRPQRFKDALGEALWCSVMPKRFRLQSTKSRTILRVLGEHVSVSRTEFRLGSYPRPATATMRRKNCVRNLVVMHDCSETLYASIRASVRTHNGSV